MGSNAQVPISFFMPESNAQELLSVYKEFCNIADELSAIPKYLTGSGTTGGAGRTSSGLAMLMNNSAKILQTVSANVDRDVVDPLMHNLYDMLMLTDVSGMLQGDEVIKVLGVNVAAQRETERARQLEFLQVTANPMDQQIMGLQAREGAAQGVAHHRPRRRGDRAERSGPRTDADADDAAATARGRRASAGRPKRTSRHR
jgi:hypothetical protein